MKHTFVLRAKRGFALGDVILTTALARDIHAAHPGEYHLMVDTHFTGVWRHNPHVEKADYTKRHQLIDLSYVDGISSSKRGNRHHFLSWFHEDFRRKTGLKVPVTLPHGDIHLSQDEKIPLVSGRYWAVVAGGKFDMTVKHWGGERHQELVGRLAHKGIRLVQLGAAHPHHTHPDLDGVLNLVGRTNDVRDFFSVLHGAEGIICGITGAMHIAACFKKPCIVLAGGREEPWWEGYVNTFYPTAFGDKCAKMKIEHKFLHTVGLMRCCRSEGCWKSKTVPITDKDTAPGFQGLCEMPLREAGRDPVPQCMDMVTPAIVTEAVTDYYREGVLPLVGDPWPEPVWRGPTEPAREHRPMPPEKPARTASGASDGPHWLSHPAIGGKLTVCVLCYGPHTGLAVRCLNSIISSMPPGSFDLRVGCNACPRETISFVRSLPVTKVYESAANRLKYPVMRDMLWDESCPIDTSYMLWFDDDSYVASPLWLEKLALCIAANHEAGCRLYGAEFIHDFARYRTPAHRPDMWFRTAPWHTGKDFYAGRAARFTAPNGTALRFVSGGFFALGTDAMRRGKIPDRRVLHNGGDIIIGEQVRQAGFKIMAFNSKKEWVHSSGAEPRGESRIGKAKRFPWQEGGEGR